MGFIGLSIGQVGITQYLLVRILKTTDPLAEYQRLVIPPPVSSSVNITFNDIDPVIYNVEYRESPDGIAIGSLLGAFVVNAKTNKILFEYRYYTVGSGLPNHPNAGEDIIDPYLNGKEIFAVYKDGFGRPLIAPTETNKEFELVSGGGIHPLEPVTFSDGETIVVHISYLQEQAPIVGGGGSYGEVIEITTATTLTSAHNNKRIRCASSTNRLVLTLADITTVPEGTGYLFTDSGLQFQTRILAASGNQFVLGGTTGLQELTFGKAESLEIEKRIISNVAYWEVIRPDPGLRMVGETFPGRWKDHLNTMPEDGRLLDGDDYPRIWWWIKNRLPVDHYIIDDNVTNPGYVHLAGKEGLFVIHSTLKKFRMPNMQGLTEKGLKDFDSYGADDQRLYDYPGGKQNELVGDHTHTGLNIRSGSHSNASSALSGNVKFLVNVAGDAAAAQPDATTGNVTGTNGKRMRVDNIGVIYLRRI